MAVSVDRHSEWIPPEQIRELSAALQDPAEVAQLRQESYHAFQVLPLEPNPLYRKYGYFAGVDLQGIDSVTRGSPVPVPLAPPDTIRIVHDARGSRADIPSIWKDRKVTYEDLSTIWSGRGNGTSISNFLRGAEKPTDRLAALGFATLNRGYRLTIPDNLAEPVRVQDLTVLSRPHEALSIRKSVRAGADTQLLFSEETYSSENGAEFQRLYGSSVDLDLGPRSKAVFLTVHAPDARTISLYSRNATLDQSSRLAWIWSGFGGFRTKARNLTTLLGQGSALEDLQTFYGSEDQAYDSSVGITHVGTDTNGRSITRGVFRDQARGMSRGLVRIEHEARRTVSLLSEHAMLLSRGARSDTIPILEILCRDVKATHSSSVAPVDPERIFYLESRGITEDDAIRMIGEGFLSYVLDRAPIGGLREQLYPFLAARWQGKKIIWSADSPLALGELSVEGTDAAPEWRFDAKLR